MKLKNTQNYFAPISKKLSLLQLFLWSVLLTNAQVTYTFTTCGATGQFGPSQAQANTTYASTNLNGLVTITGQGIQQWVVPGTGAYKIEAWGAQGGPNWGLGAYVSGEFNLTGGNTLKIIVGQQGGSNNNSHGSGGGGSFVAVNNTPLLVAGGGGGRGASSSAILPVSQGTIGIDGQSPVGGGPGGTGGGGGAAANGATGGTSVTPGAGSTSSTWSSGGGGFYTDGGMYSNNTLNGGRAFLNGGLGGDPATSGGNSPGGFGGGGGCGDRAAGGGGYSGGGGGTSGTDAGGGGSYNGGINQSNASGVNAGMGKVLITRLCNVDLQASKNPICLGESITLSTNAVSNIVWGHTGSTSNTVNVSPTSNTSYTVIGQAATGCTTAIVLTVVVNPLPSLSAVVVPSVLCVGKAATITASGANTYTWSSLSVTAPSATVNPAVTTSYNYSGTNQYGCVNSSVVAVNVNTNSLGITPNTSICEGASIVLTANNAVTYTWSTGNNFQSTPVSPITNTTYLASGTDIHNCVLSNAVNITVDPRPNVSASASKNTICKGESVNLMASGASTYTWSGAAGTGAQVTINPPADVVYYYTVTGTSANGCTNTATVAVTVSRCSGLSKMSSNAAASRIYPNPASTEVTVEIGNGLLNTIEVTDLTGRMVMSVITRESSTKLSLDKLSNGVYYFKIRSAENVEVIRVVKNN